MPTFPYGDSRYIAAAKQLRKTDHVCHHCGYPIDPQLRYPHPLSWSADHIIPKSKLSKDDPRMWHITNLQATHLRCNQSRGDKPHHQASPPPLNW